MINIIENFVLSFFSVFPVICHLLYLEPCGKNKHVIALCNLYKANSYVTHNILKILSSTRYIHATLLFLDNANISKSQ